MKPSTTLVGACCEAALGYRTLAASPDGRSIPTVGRLTWSVQGPLQHHRPPAASPDIGFKVRKRLRACLGASDQQRHTSPIGVLHRAVANGERESIGAGFHKRRSSSRGGICLHHGTLVTLPGQRRIPRLNKLPRVQHSVRLHSNDGVERREPPEALRTGYDAGHYHASSRLDKPVKVRFDADASQSAELEPESPFERESLKGLARWQRAEERPTGSVPPVHRSGS
ncbi:hypothetical protein CPLU01_08250 [Colletotrichum plurivorum]|uniref:Uncharacterized protein n=1 Tax=Colletotrichum plurivorum TaxID=2175906 RepID=A0A8H6KC75_9PEZI|nr:hypothetical protein CPLU01_08250 [Colletotrichum plurivorum]